MTLFDPLGWAIILLAVGCGFLVLEVFIPSGGLFGFLASIAIIASMVMGFRRGTTTGLTFMAVTVVLVPIVIGLAFKYWPMTPMGRAFLGEAPLEDQVRVDDPRRRLVGRVGVTRSKMLPSGSVMIDGELVDAVSQGLAIDLGVPVVVVEVRGNRVMVRAAQPHETQSADIPTDDLLSRPIQDFGLESMDESVS